ncbi:MAG: hypothetical protein IIB00_10065 [candidate division Zixibacteria bacterium]|nr:hypothetical protein [candidate division Zixibacteria bacterium]
MKGIFRKSSLSGIVALLVFVAIVGSARAGENSRFLSEWESAARNSEVFSMRASFFSQNTPVEIDYNLSASSASNKVSLVKALALSIILPGAGHWYVGDQKSARVFMGIETGIWLGYLGFRSYGSWKENDFIRFAQEHAGIDPEGKDDEFYRTITFYDNREQYNALGRAFDPELPFFPSGPEFDWRWDSPESQEMYRELNNDQRSAIRNSEFMFVAAAVNRLAAALLAIRSVKKRNSRLDDEYFGLRKPAKSPAGPPVLATFQLTTTDRSATGLKLLYTQSF